MLKEPIMSQKFMHYFSAKYQFFTSTGFMKLTPAFKSNLNSDEILKLSIIISFSKITKKLQYLRKCLDRQMSKQQNLDRFRQDETCIDALTIMTYFHFYTLGEKLIERSAQRKDKRFQFILKHAS